ESFFADEEAVAVTVHKIKKGCVVVELHAQRGISTGSPPPKYILKKRLAPEARDTATKLSAVPHLKRPRPISGLNSHWKPTSGTRDPDEARDPSPSPPPNIFNEGSDGDQFQASSTPTPEPAHDDRREYDDREDHDVSTTVGTPVTPTKSVCLTASNSRARVSKSKPQMSQIHQDSNTMTKVSTPVVTTLGPKLHKPVGTPGKCTRKQRWMTNSLDEVIRPLFNGEFMAKVREFAGTLPPFSAPSVNDIQALLDEMYSDVSLIIAKSNVLYDLTLQHLKEWRLMIGSKALRNTKADIEAKDPNGNDTEGRAFFASAATYVEWALSSPDSKNSPMYWARWNNGVGKEGRFQFHLILKTLSAHLASIPPNTNECPYCALIMSLLAVEQAVKFSQTGVPIVPHGPQGFFSEENWDDKKIRTNEGKVKTLRQ
ncbi:hypothetical protein OF83DRAFT_1089683, partial [Amylostereum chailletii]